MPAWHLSVNSSKFMDSHLHEESKSLACMVCEHGQTGWKCHMVPPTSQDDIKGGQRCANHSCESMGHRAGRNWRYNRGMRYWASGNGYPLVF